MFFCRGFWQIKLPRVRSTVAGRHLSACTSFASSHVGTQLVGATSWVTIDFDRVLSTSTVGWHQRKHFPQSRCRVFWAPHFFCDPPVTFQFSPDVFRGNPICLSISKCSICIPDLVACILEICVPKTFSIGCKPPCLQSTPLCMLQLNLFGCLQAPH